MVDTVRHTDVLVVGAGPTGLMVAGELARRGVAVRVIEKRSARQPLSKALVLQARTLEVMDLIGIAGEFLRRGYPAPGLNIGLGGRTASVEMRDLPTDFPYMLVLPQQETEEILERHLRDHGAGPERGHELMGIEQDESGVRARVLHPDGSEKIVVCKYLVACDGAHSTVRPALGLPFKGKDYETIVFLADVKLDRTFNPSRITNFTSSRGFVSVLPFLGEYARVFAVDFTKQDRPVHEPLTLPDLQDTLDAVLPFRVGLSEPRWITRFRSPSRQVPTNRLGRVFLAGDAAHAHSPAGGQGMNNGLQDAFNLGWKLAMVVRGEAPEQLLDTFDAERHPVDARAQRQTDLMFRSFLLRNPMLKMARNTLLSTLMRVPAMRQKLALDLSGIGIGYGFTDRSREDRTTETASGIAPGDRIPNASLWSPGHPGLRLYNLFREPGYLLLACVSFGRLTSDAGLIRDLMSAVAHRYAGAVRAYVILDEGVADEANVGAPVLVDFKGEFRRKLGTEHGSVLLVRPDGYLALHHKGFAPASLPASLARWVHRRELDQSTAELCDAKIESNNQDHRLERRNRNDHGTGAISSCVA
jgi:2-polyprenyl-6-methoxyphenol hydroxylase-like FAD-dependent oxidoreductase